MFLDKYCFLPPTLCVWKCIPPWRGQRTLGACYGSSLFLRDLFLSFIEPIVLLVRHTEQQIPDILLCLPYSALDYRRAWPCWAFYVGARDQTSLNAYTASAFVHWTISIVSKQGWGDSTVGLIPSTQVEPDTQSKTWVWSSPAEAKALAHPSSLSLLTHKLKIISILYY